MAKLPRKARQTDGVTWSCAPYTRGYYLQADYDICVSNHVEHGKLRVWVPGSAVLDQAVNLIQGRINQQRYAAAH